MWRDTSASQQTLRRFQQLLRRGRKDDLDDPVVDFREILGGRRHVGGKELEGWSDSMQSRKYIPLTIDFVGVAR